MAAYKDEERGTWYVSFYYEDWTGAKKRKVKRGFRTKKEALNFEAEYKRTAKADMDMTMGEFVEVYFRDKSQSLKDRSIKNKRDTMKAQLLPYFKDLKNIKKYKQMGVNYITLCHSYDNDICHSSTHTEDATQGLTQFGREVVKEMNRLGIMIDISHASEGTFWDVIKYSTQPIIASHSSSKALCDHDRNLTDEQLRALAKNGGVAQLCLLDAYINKKTKAASICDAVEHLDHMIKVAGIDHVGIGTDFDGGGGLQGCKGDNDLINLTIKMIEKGYTEEDLRKIWGGNLLRVMKQVQEAPLLSSKKRR